MPLTDRLKYPRPRKPLIHRIILVSLAVALIVAGTIAFSLFRSMLRPNVNLPAGASVSVFIPTGASYSDVMDILADRSLLIQEASFHWMAQRKKYPDHVKPGHYVIMSGMNNNALVNLLRSGAQTPVKVVFNNIRIPEELAGRISRQIEADSLSLLQCWKDADFLKSFGATPQLVFSLFIPNTYELWWNTDARDFTRRMARESGKFWEGERTEKAIKLGLGAAEVMILASIVEKETQLNAEKPDIAGVYLNRLRKSWPLQADPTLVFASGDFGLKRVLNIHKDIDSPYNTYKYTGLPPGPICLPSISSIDAVLNARKHEYMFFCARDDMSGSHVFARTLAEHNRNAARYQQALNRMNF
jgi:UPF0755 protein